MRKTSHICFWAHSVTNILLLCIHLFFILTVCCLHGLNIKPATNVWNVRKKHNMPITRGICICIQLQYLRKHRQLYDRYQVAMHSYGAKGCFGCLYFLAEFTWFFFLSNIPVSPRPMSCLAEARACQSRISCKCAPS